ncbi:MAG: hypothetical protein FJ271_12885 [Planctomycetes bacterium]|nr:hypothetical protein [Planctomycetota bacterium]
MKLTTSISWVLAAGYGLLVASFACAQPGSDPRAQNDERLLREKQVGTDGPALIRFFKSRTPTPQQIAELSAKIQQLGASSYNDRQQARADIIKAGELAKPLLFDVLKDPKANLETARRAELCLRHLNEGNEAVLAAAVARMLARVSPIGAHQTLIDYLPFADAQVVEDIQSALATLGARDPEHRKVLTQALHGEHPNQRIAAAVVLCRQRTARDLDIVASLLNDPIPSVRLHVALKLVEAREKKAIPVLIELLGKLPPGNAWKAEEMLIRLAGDKASTFAQTSDLPPVKLQQSWSDWWALAKDKIDLAKLDLAQSYLGLTLISQMDPRGTNGKVYELKPSKEVAWQIDGLRYPLDAQIVGKDRVLVAEYLNRRVTERDLKGVIHWEKQVDMPIGCQRLSNGNTFIATRRQLLVVEPSGKEAFNYVHQNTSIAAATRLRDGRMVVVSTGGQLTWLDAAGKPVRSFQVGAVYTMGGNIDVLPGDRILVPEFRSNRVVEYDAEGKPRWQVSAQRPTSAVRLPNGNTLVVNMLGQQVVEFNRDGREVWKHQTDGRPWRARRR